MKDTEEKDREQLSKDEREQLDLEDLDEFLSGIEPGYTVMISRVEPGWCKGFLEERSIDEVTEPVSLNNLINTWGGHRLRLKFRSPGGTWLKHKDIYLYSYEPLIWGAPLKRNAPNPHLPSSTDDAPKQTALAPPPPAPPPPAPDTKKEMMELLQMMQAMRAADMQAMAALMQNNREPGPDPYRMMQNAFGLFSQIQSTMRPAVPAGEGENDEVLGLLGKLAEMFSSNRKEEQPARITPPRSGGSGAPLHEQLAGMEPSQALLTFRQAVASMPRERQEQTMSELLGSIEQIGGTDLLLSQLEQRGILGIEGDDDTLETENDSDEDTGGES